MSDDILNRILAEMQENRAETRRLGERVDHLEVVVTRLVAVMDRAEGRTDRLAAKVDEVEMRVQASALPVVGNLTTGVSQSHRLDSLDLRMKLIERRLELRATP